MVLTIDWATRLIAFRPTNFRLRVALAGTESNVRGRQLTASSLRRGNWTLRERIAQAAISIATSSSHSVPFDRLSSSVESGSRVGPV